MQLPKMTTRRWILAVAVVALGIVVAQTIALIVEDAQQRGVFQRQSNPEGWPD